MFSIDVKDERVYKIVEARVREREREREKGKGHQMRRRVSK